MKLVASSPQVLDLWTAKLTLISTQLLTPKVQKLDNKIGLGPTPPPWFTGPILTFTNSANMGLTGLPKRLVLFPSMVNFLLGDVWRSHTSHPNGKLLRNGKFGCETSVSSHTQSSWLNSGCFFSRGHLLGGQKNTGVTSVSKFENPGVSREKNYQP